MRVIGSRQFRQHLYTELKNLPFIVTTYGKPSYIVSNDTNDLAEYLCNYKEGCDEVGIGKYNILHIKSNRDKTLLLCQRHRDMYANSPYFKIELNEKDDIMSTTITKGSIHVVTPNEPEVEPQAGVYGTPVPKDFRG